MRNALVIGCGKKFAQSITDDLASLDYSIYGISSKNFDNNNYLHVDWETCSIFYLEKFIKSLPKLEIIIFNQNYPALGDSTDHLGSESVEFYLKQSKKWMQAHYVNCILPYQMLQSLTVNDKLFDDTTVCWMLSRSALSLKLSTSLDYSGQKYQNYITMKQLAMHNSQTFLGFCPTHLDDDDSQILNQARSLVNLLTNTQASMSGKVFKLTQENDCVEMNVDKKSK
jgi:hypothetical protein